MDDQNIITAGDTLANMLNSPRYFAEEFNLYDLQSLAYGIFENCEDFNFCNANHILDNMDFEVFETEQEARKAEQNSDIPDIWFTFENSKNQTVTVH